MKPTDAERLLEAVGARPPRAEDPLVDGLRPALVLEPPSAADAARALSLCREEGLAVVAVGGATRLGLGNVPARLDALLSTRRLDRIEDYEPRDATLTAEAGVPLAALERVVRAEGQCLPWDPPRPDRATVGGVVATGDPGLRRVPGARPRDLLLGAEVALADGTIVKTGGRVVKNVTGYELGKLLVGSLGTLALLLRLHLRVRPVPETAASLLVSSKDAAGLGAAYRAVRTAPVAAEATALLDPTTAVGLALADWCLLLRFEGREEEVRAGLAAAEARVRPLSAARLEPREADAVWEAVRDFAIDGPDPAAGLVVRGHATTLETFRLAERWHPLGPVLALPETGRVLVRFDDPAAFASVLAEGRAVGAAVVLETAPPSMKRDRDVFGDPPGGFALMRRLKEKLDPTGVLAPGRFVGRI